MKQLPETYELIRQEELNDIHATGYVLMHKKSGARLALIENDDENKVFYVGFRTPPEDSTGVAHIIEHTVLCGSRKYPLKDPFVELVKGSLNTFLNAMTYPDKTVYPVASTNEQDFKNLMDVYLDAVFYPNIYRRREIFKQEGWHYEMDDPDGELTINGVVYNEMKGAFSSPDDVLERQIMNSLFPDTTYGNESGGDPKNIPDLTYEKYLDFHRRFYHPCNSYIYLYGAMDMTERLQYLDREYLSKYDRIALDSEIQLQKAFTKPRQIEKQYSVSEGKETENQTYLSENYVCDSVLNPELYQAFDILDYALLNAPGAPIRKALLEAGIGQDIMGGYDSGTRQPVFSIIAKNANLKDRDRFLQIIQDTLKKQVQDGIDKNALYAAINSNQFRFREADFGSFPKGLIWGLQLLDSWLYDENEPFMHLNGVEILNQLTKKVEEGYFERLTEKYLLKNTHRSVVTLLPKQGLTSEEDAALKEKLEQIKLKMSEETRRDIVEQTRELKEYQQTPDSEEDLRKLPMLKRSDLKQKIRPLDLIKKEVHQIPVIYSQIETNGIHYLDFAFRIHSLKQEEIAPLSLLTKILGMVDTKEYSYTDFANEVNKTTGGIATSLVVLPKRDQSYGLNFEIRLKFLYENAPEAMDLMQEMLFASNFSNHARIREIVLQEKARMEGEMASSGHALAALRASSHFSMASRISDEAGGICYYQFLCRLLSNFDSRIEGLISTWQNLMKTVLCPLALVVSTTGEESYGQVEENLPAFLQKLYPDISEKKNNDAFRNPVENLLLTRENEGFKDASKIHYVCCAGNFKDAGFSYRATMKILKVILGYDYFWINVRVKGGAYGCMSSFTRDGNLYFVSYRDPNLEKTREIFRNTPAYIRSFNPDERDMTKYIIGTVSALDTPLTPSQRGIRALVAYLNDISEEMLQKERDEVLHATKEDIRELADLVEEVMKQGYFCVIGNEVSIEEHAELFTKVEHLL